MSKEIWENEKKVYEQVLSKTTDEDERKTLKSHIKIFDFLATCEDWERLMLFDSSAFNDIVEGYVLLCGDKLGYSQKQKSELTTTLRGLFDSTDSSNAFARYINDDLDWVTGKY